MEKIRSIVLTLNPVAGVTDSEGRQEFDFNIQIKTEDGSEPKKREVLWLLKTAIETVQNADE